MGNGRPYSFVPTGTQRFLALFAQGIIAIALIARTPADRKRFAPRLTLPSNQWSTLHTTFVSDEGFCEGQERDKTFTRNDSESIMSSRLKYWIPAILVALLISLFSTHYFSSEHTERFIYPLLRWIFPAASPRILHRLHSGIRKLAHITEFGVFSATVFRGIRSGRPGWRLDWAVSTFFIALAFAALDEWHQSFVPVRQASARDVAIDALGAVLAQVLVWAYAHWRRLHQAATSLGKDIR